MISEEQALERIFARMERVGDEMVPLAQADGRVAAEDLRARLASPPFDNSAMDGYAVRAGDARKGARLQVTGCQPAGRDLALRVGEGKALRIFTGAPVPAEADAVVMQEDVSVEGERIVLHENVAPGEAIRRRGTDLCEGQMLLEKGACLTPGMLGLLAAQGIGELRVSRRVRVAILSTGDELRPSGSALGAGEIYESNGTMLSALVTRAGGEPVPLGIAPDDPHILRARLAEGLSNDVLIVSGGVSVGERDFVKAELEALGVALDLWRVAIKPGKPFAFGHCGRTAVFGLPGNPVSAFVTFLVFVRPALLHQMGARNCHLPTFPASASVEISNPGDRPHYLRGKLEQGRFTPFGRQESHALFGLSRSDALVRLPAGACIPAGAGVKVLVI